MDSRTRDKHLKSLRQGIMYLEGHKATAHKAGKTAQDVIGEMMLALQALGFAAIAAEAFADGMHEGSKLPKVQQDTVQVIAKPSMAVAAKYAPTPKKVYWDMPNYTNHYLEPMPCDWPSIERGLPRGDCRG